MQSMIFNGLLYNLMWLGSIHYQNVFVPVVMLWAFVHLLTKATTLEKGLVLFVFCFGILLDSAFMQLGIFQFQSGEHNVINVFIPLWLCGIWLSFSLTIFHSLSPLSKSVVMQVFIGTLIAPMSYFLGRKLGAVEFGLSDLKTFFVLAVSWGVFLPLVFQLKKYLFDCSNKVKSDEKANSLSATH